MKNINVKDLHDLLPTIGIIDVREPSEYSTGHIPTARNIPMNGLVMNHESFLKKEKTYYIVCQSGGRSNMVAGALANLGYNVINVTGGTSQYAANYETER